MSAWKKKKKRIGGVRVRGIEGLVGYEREREREREREGERKASVLVKLE